MTASQEATTPNLVEFDFPGLEGFVRALGEAPFRTKQLWQWIWQKGETDFAAMTDLSKSFREKLTSTAIVRLPEVHAIQTSGDGTVKFLLRLQDGELIETVLIPERTHWTQCLSTQVGCALACTFCSTGGLGFTRNLTGGEIAAQALAARRHIAGLGDERILRNLVFMGMGEPLLNWPEVRKSLETFRHPLGLDFSSRRMTVSTVGIPGFLEEFGATGLASLAVSLHAPDQALRERIMPKASRLPLPELIDILRRYPLKERQRITFEYILLGGVNDSPAQARDLVRLINPLKAKVNLIAYNPGPDIPYAAPSQDAVLAFEQVLRDKDVTVILRKSRGGDIAAACGQLRRSLG